MMDLGSNNCFVTGTPCLNDGHGYDFVSSVSHPRPDSIGLLIYDSNACAHIQSITVVLQVPHDSNNPAEKGLISWIDHLELNYDMTLFISIYYIYIAYIIILYNKIILECM